jgi:hypothetical protein
VEKVILSVERKVRQQIIKEFGALMLDRGFKKAKPPYTKRISHAPFFSRVLNEQVIQVIGFKCISDLNIFITNLPVYDFQFCRNISDDSALLKLQEVGCFDFDAVFMYMHYNYLGYQTTIIDSCSLKDDFLERNRNGMNVMLNDLDNCNTDLKIIDFYSKPIKIYEAQCKRRGEECSDISDLFQGLYSKHTISVYLKHFLSDEKIRARIMQVMHEALHGRADGKPGPHVYGYYSVPEKYAEV